MKTPKEYSQNISNKIITDEMLENCLFSVNKRAKNWRDKVREYKEQNGYYTETNLQNAEDQRDKYYCEKEFFLQFLKPDCIHKEFYGYERKRIYDYEPDYEANKDKFVWTNHYFDRDIGDQVYFGDVELKEYPQSISLLLILQIRKSFIPQSHRKGRCSQISVS